MKLVVKEHSHGATLGFPIIREGEEGYYIPPPTGSLIEQISDWRDMLVRQIDLQFEANKGFNLRKLLEMGTKIF